MQIEAHSGGCSCILDQSRMAVYFQGDCEGLIEQYYAWVGA